MAFTTYNSVYTSSPVTRKYYSYLDDPFVWRSKYNYSIPYWTRYYDEYERSRTSLRYMEDAIDDMTAKARGLLNKTSSTYVPSSTYTSTYIPSTTYSSSTYVPEYYPSTYVSSSTYVPSSTYSSSSVTNYNLENEIASWRSAMSSMHSTMDSFWSKTETMGNRISSMLTDADRAHTLKTEFGVESMIGLLERQRRDAETVCSRIYDALNMPKPSELFVGKYYRY